MKIVIELYGRGLRRCDKWDGGGTTAEKEEVLVAVGSSGGCDNLQPLSRTNKLLGRDDEEKWERKAGKCVS